MRVKNRMIGFFCLIAIASNAQNIRLTIKSLKPAKGQLCIAIFTSNNDFKQEKPYWSKCFPKVDKNRTELTYTIPLPPGKYGVSVLDDENENSKMDYNLLGVPREGFGLSGYYQTGLHRPRFEDFFFYLEKNETKDIVVRMKYF